MSTIAVLGATGTAGSLVVREAASRGHKVIAVSRSNGVDLLTGGGLAEAIAGADSVIDASSPGGPGSAVETLGRAASNVTRACAEAGVPHLVVLSIAGIDSPGFDGFDYYLGKRRQETIAQHSGVPYTILRSAQWFEFGLHSSAVSHDRDEVIAEDWSIQPIAVRTVARILVDLATATPLLGVRLVAGPDRMRLPELTRRCLAALDDDRPVRSIPARLPAFADGTLLASAGSELHEPTLERWLTTVQQF